MNTKELRTKLNQAKEKAVLQLQELLYMYENVERLQADITTALNDKKCLSYKTEKSKVDYINNKLFKDETLYKNINLTNCVGYQENKITMNKNIYNETTYRVNFYLNLELAIKDNKAEIVVRQNIQDNIKNIKELISNFDMIWKQKEKAFLTILTAIKDYNTLIYSIDFNCFVSSIIGYEIYDRNIDKLFSDVLHL